MMFFFFSFLSKVDYLPVPSLKQDRKRLGREQREKHTSMAASASTNVYNMSGHRRHINKSNFDLWHWNMKQIDVRRDNAVSGGGEELTQLHFAGSVKYSLVLSFCKSNKLHCQTAIFTHTHTYIYVLNI